MAKTYGITFKMFWMSVDHAPPERSRLPADKRCIDSNPREKKDPLGSSKIGVDLWNRLVNVFSSSRILYARGRSRPHAI